MKLTYRYDVFKIASSYLGQYKSRISLRYIFYFENKIMKKGRMPPLSTADDIDIYAENGYPCKQRSYFIQSQDNK